MSRAKPAAERVSLDAYQTPATLAEAICATLARLIDEPHDVLEPSAGLGSFVRAARACWPKARIIAIDVEPHVQALAAAGADHALRGDCLQRIPDLSIPSRPLLIVGNPPYREAAAHVEAALAKLCDGEHLAFLLRLNLLGAASRISFWKGSPLWAVLPVVPRPSFVGGGSDATEYGCFVWRKGFAGAARILPPIVWRKPGRRAA